MFTKKVLLEILVYSIPLNGINQKLQVSFKDPLPQAYFMETLYDTLPSHPKIRSLTFHLMQEWYLYKAHNNRFDIDQLVLALIYGAEKHYGQIRKDSEATPYIIHPLQVCCYLWDIGGVRNSNILIAAILHDTLEDTSATEEEIEKLFGHRICETVKEVTNNPNLGSEENKQRQVDHAPQMSQDARLVKLADRLANVIDLRIPPPKWPTEKIEIYFNWGQKLLDALRGTHTELEVALQTALDAHNHTSNK